MSNVTALPGVRTFEPDKMSADCIPVLERLLEMAKTGELTGIIGVVQTVNGGLGNVSAGGSDLHPYATLGALDALHTHHKLSIMQHTQMKPGLAPTTGGDDDAPKQS